ncbi:MAG: galactokinase, partial [Actinomycetota bacterium]|nr:galactokinase [Actinomycetota bacterium]
MSSAHAGDAVSEVSLSDVRPGHPTGWTAYVAGVAWALEQAGHRVPGADIVVVSDVPVGAGLSSSAALECSVMAAFDRLLHIGMLGQPAGRARAAHLCQLAENDIAGAPTGGMDQAASLRTTRSHALLLDSRSGAVRQVPFEPERHGLALLVVDTRAEHALVDGQYAERRATCEHAAEALGVATLREVPMDGLDEALDRLDDERARFRVRHVVTEIERVVRCVAALEDDDFDTVGELFTESHASLRDDYEVSCAELDLVVGTALGCGALGARMTGAGFGGSAIALVRADEVETVSASVERAFADSGLRAPASFAVTAGGPAARDL